MVIKVSDWKKLTDLQKFNLLLKKSGMKSMGYMVLEKNKPMHIEVHGLIKKKI